MLPLPHSVQVRQRVREIQHRLSLALLALRGAALGNAAFTAQHLQQLAALVQPLLASPLVGEDAAFGAAAALASSLPRPLCQRAVSIAAALRLVALGGGVFTGVHHLGFVVWCISRQRAGRFCLRSFLRQWYMVRASSWACCIRDAD